MNRILWYSIVVIPMLAFLSMGVAQDIADSEESVEESSEAAKQAGMAGFVLGVLLLSVVSLLAIMYLTIHIKRVLSGT